MKERILLVDDNEEFLDSVADVLSLEGYEVVTATCGEDGVRLAQAEDFGAVVMDIRMPGMNGVEGFFAIKGSRPDAKVILVTAYEMEDLVCKAEAGGVTAVLPKPLDMGAFLKLVGETVGKGRDGLVLLVDDDEALCDNLSDNLSEAGYDVAIAHTGEEAFRLAAERPFDILLLDMKLPRANGLEVYRAVKRVRPGIVALVITGYAEEHRDLIHQALEESAYGCLPKPLDVEGLLSTLGTIRTALREGNYAKPGGVP